MMPNEARILFNDDPIYRMLIPGPKTIRFINQLILPVIATMFVLIYATLAVFYYNYPTLKY